jgi:site-specific DNA-methyltransferase (adenine-specific)/adenine-specific DNA-methyltransferase
MPTLDWIGKKAVLDHHRQVPYRLLKCDASLSAGDPDSGNLLIQGDNLLALKALLPYYAGKVKCIYIDPPYNTGNEKWVYNDAVNSPEMQRWLGKVVGAEAEDLCRHDKWLCMMYPRLSLLRDFLTGDGVIFVSIDDTEAHNLKSLMNEIFGPQSWVCTLIWKRRQTSDSRNLNGVSADHEYILCYGRGAGVRFLGQVKDLSKYSNPDNDPNGPWMSDNLTGLANAAERPNLHYDIIHPSTGKRYPPHPSRGWIYGPEKMADLIAAGRILWPRSSKGRPRLKRFISDMKSQTTGFSTILQAPANVAGTKHLAGLLGPKVFAFPKPPGLVDILLRQVTETDSVIMDSFAGSGTTGHAVLALNKQDGGNRRFILVEMEEEVCRSITARRLAMAVAGYATRAVASISDRREERRSETAATDSAELPEVLADGRRVEGLGGGFRYCGLGEPLFDESGKICGTVTFPDLAAHVYFTETGTPIPKRATSKNPLLGEHGGKAIYLLFNGVLGDKSTRGGNVLTNEILRGLPEPTTKDGLKVIYGEGCRLGEARLKREGIVFKQVPYAIKVS